MLQLWLIQLIIMFMADTNNGQNKKKSTNNYGLNIWGQFFLCFWKSSLLLTDDLFDKI